MSRPDLEALKSKWVSKLRLGNYDIAIAYVKNLCADDDAPLYGFMHPINLDAGIIEILIQDPSTWPSGDKPCDESTIEEIVIHELSHVRLLPLTYRNRDPSAILAEEQAVWAFAGALRDASETQRGAMVRAMSVASPSLAKRAMEASARSRAGERKSMGPEEMKAAIEALKGGDGTKALEVLEALLMAALGAATGGAGGGGEGQAMGAGEQEAGSSQDQAQNGGGMPARAAHAPLARVGAYEARMMRAVRVTEDEAKRSIVRTMRADGIALTPAAEKRILSASTLEEAEERAALVRDMIPPADDGGGQRNALAGQRGQVQPRGGRGADLSQLNEAQRKSHAQYLRKGRQDLADQLVVRAAKANDRARAKREEV